MTLGASTEKNTRTSNKSAKSVETHNKSRIAFIWCNVYDLDPQSFTTSLHRLVLYPVLIEHFGLALRASQGIINLALQLVCDLTGGHKLWRSKIWVNDLSRNQSCQQEKKKVDERPQPLHEFWTLRTLLACSVCFIADDKSTQYLPSPMEICCYNIFRLTTWNQEIKKPTIWSHNSEVFPAKMQPFLHFSRHVILLGTDPR